MLIQSLVTAALQHADAIASPYIVGVVMWALFSGLVAAWLSERYVENVDDDEFAFADLQKLSCLSCSQLLTLSDLAKRPFLECSHCAARLSNTWLYTPAAVLVTSLLTVATFGMTPILIPYLWLIPVLAVAATVDMSMFLIPRRVVWIGAIVGLVLITLVALDINKLGSVSTAITGGLAFFGVMLIFNLIYPSGMGFGDVRLSALLGIYLAWLGITLVIWGLLFGCLIGLAMGITRRVTAKTEEAKYFPFGPGLAMGALVAIWFSQDLLP